MLGSLGSLVVSLEADIARFQSDMGKAVYQVERAAKQIDDKIGGALDGLNNKLVGIAAGVAAIASVGALSTLINETVAATAALDDMSERTGIAVEELSKMSDVAKIGGHDINLVEAAANRLVKGLSSVDDETKGVGKALQALGIEARDSRGNIRPLGELLPEIGAKLDKYKDSTSKAALVQDAFGKGGTKVIPFLKDYVELGDRAASVTADQAAAAEQYEKSLNTLRLQKEQLTKAIVLASLPALQAMADVLLDNKKAADAADSSLKNMAADGSVTSWAEQAALSIASFVDYLKVTVATVKAVGGSFQVVAADVGLLNAAAGVALGKVSIAELKKVYEERNKTLDTANKRYEELMNMDTEATRKALEERLRLNREAAKAERELAAQRPPKSDLDYKPGDEAALKRARAEAEKLAKTLNEIYNKPLGIDSGFQDKLDGLTQSYLQGRVSVDQYREAVAQLMSQQPFAKKMVEDQAKAFDEAFEAQEKARLATERQIKSAREMVEGLEFEVAAMRMSNKEREVAIRLRELEKSGVEKGTAAYEMFAARITAAVEAKEGMQANIDMFKSIESVAHEAWNNIGTSGENTFEKLEKSLRSGLYELLYQMTVKKWLIDIGANITGMSPSALGGGGGGNSILNMLTSGGGGMAGSIMSSIGGSIIGMGGGMAGGLGAFVGGIGELGLLGSMGASTSAGFTALGAGNIMGGIGSLLGPTAIAIGGIYALHKAFGDKGENWKGRLGFGQQAQAYTTNGVFGPEGFAYLAGNDATNKGIQNFMASTAGLDKQISRGLSESQIKAIQNRLAGYNRRTDGQPAEFAFSKDDKTAAEQLSSEYLKVKYGAVFDEVNAKLGDMVRGFSGTSEELLKFIGGLAQTQELIASFNEADPLADAAELYENSQKRFASASKQNAKTIEDLIAAYDDSADSTNALAQATANYYVAQVQLMAQIDTIIQSISDMFNETADRIRLAGLDEQGQYDFYQQRADDNFSALLGSSDPEQIQRLAEKINADINAAFGLLDADDQRAQSGDFLERLKNLNEAVNTKLKEVQSQLATDTKDVMTQVGKLLSGAAATNQAAADTQLQAANTQLAAAQIGTNVTVDFADRPGQQVGTFNLGGA